MSTPACQLYLVMPVGTPQAATRLGQMLAGGHVASLLLTPAADGTFDPTAARPLVKLAQAKGVAVLVADDPAMAQKVGADGVHLADDPFEYDAARRLLGAKAIVGVDVGLSRHDAMELGERGADYIAFAETGEDTGEDPEVGVAQPLPERIAWWAEVFTVPCIAWDMLFPEEASEYAALGADFVAIAPEAWADAADPALVIDAFAAAVARTPAGARRAGGDA